MSEKAIISKTSSPLTQAILAADLRKLGLKNGAIALIHSSLSSLGWVCGGPVTVVKTLMDVVTPAGTLVMPAQSGDYSDPAEWQNPPVPRDWWPIIYEAMPAFDPKVTPTRNMGRIAEIFRSWPEVQRSLHPSVSFAAWGQYAEAIIKNHSLNNSLGEKSPLARLYDLNS